MKEKIQYYLLRTLSFIRTIPLVALLPVVLLFVLVGLIGFTVNRSQTVASKEIYATLASIKFIEDTPLGPQEINFTDKTVNIFGASVQRGEKLFITTEELVQEIKIEEVVFPPIREERLKIVDKANQGFVENYFRAVYNLLSSLNTEEDLNQLTVKAIDGDTNQIEYERNKTKAIYREMYRLEVPSQAKDLHISYLRIIQTQYNLYNNIISINDDPARLRIDLIVTQEILTRLQEKVNLQLEEVSEEYQIQLERSNTTQ
jgi:hypothetical protein